MASRRSCASALISIPWRGISFSFAIGAGTVKIPGLGSVRLLGLHNGWSVPFAWPAETDGAAVTLRSSDLLLLSGVDLAHASPSVV